MLAELRVRNAMLTRYCTASQRMREMAGSFPDRPAALAHQSPMLVIELSVCGLSIAGLSLLAHHCQRDLPCLTLFTGLVGGVFFVLWAALGRRTACCRLGSMMTPAEVTALLLIQVVLGWRA